MARAGCSCLSEKHAVMMFFGTDQPVGSFLRSAYWFAFYRCTQVALVWPLAVTAVVAPGPAGRRAGCSVQIVGSTSDGRAGGGRSDPQSCIVSVVAGAGYLLALSPNRTRSFPISWLAACDGGAHTVSAYLHSATMVKPGYFLLARFLPALSDTDLWFFLGSITA